MVSSLHREPEPTTYVQWYHEARANALEFIDRHKQLITPKGVEDNIRAAELIQKDVCPSITIYSNPNYAFIVSPQFATEIGMVDCAYRRLATIRKWLDRVITLLYQNDGFQAAEMLDMIRVQICRIRIKGLKDRIADGADLKAEGRGMSWMLLLQTAIVGSVLGDDSHLWSASRTT